MLAETGPESWSSVGFSHQKGLSLRHFSTEDHSCWSVGSQIVFHSFWLVFWRVRSSIRSRRRNRNVVDHFEPVSKKTLCFCEVCKFMVSLASKLEQQTCLNFAVHTRIIRNKLFHNHVWNLLDTLLAPFRNDFWPPCEAVLACLFSFCELRASKRTISISFQFFGVFEQILT